MRACLRSSEEKRVHSLIGELIAGFTCITIAQMKLLPWTCCLVNALSLSDSGHLICASGLATKHSNMIPVILAGCVQTTNSVGTSSHGTLRQLSLNICFSLCEARLCKTRLCPVLCSLELHAPWQCFKSGTIGQTKAHTVLIASEQLQPIRYLSRIG